MIIDSNNKKYKNLIQKRILFLNYILVTFNNTVMKK